MNPDPPAEHEEQVDPDVDLRDPGEVAEVRPREWDLLLAIAVGGVVGAEARYAIGVALPHASSAFPWATLLINASGSLLIGALMAVLGSVAAHRLARPFLGVGVLGGYTTFSTFGVDIDQLVHAGRVGAALGYLLATVVLCLAGVGVGHFVASRVVS